MVNGFKAGTITWEQYTESYTSLMRCWYAGHYPFNPAPFDQFMTLGRVVLLCYCTDHHCHRYLAADILSAIARSKGIEVVLEGEITNLAQ
jgi:hypothetical protein